MKEFDFFYEPTPDEAFFAAEAQYYAELEQAEAEAQAQAEAAQAEAEADAAQRGES